MGRKSRMKWERRASAAQADKTSETKNQFHGISQLKTEIKKLADEEVSFWKNEKCPTKTTKSHLEDILAFESLQSGPSLFEGLQKNGVSLPHPDQLDEIQSIRKIHQILKALAKIYVFVVGLERFSPKEAYSKLWEETLWEGCYIKKKTPGGVTIMDASHSMSRSEIQRCFYDLMLAQRLN